MELDGKLELLSGERLKFAYQTESIAFGQDADAQESQRAGREGSIGVNALKGPKRIDLSGKYTVDEIDYFSWLPETWYEAGTVMLRVSRYFQAMNSGISGTGNVGPSSESALWDADTVVDGDITPITWIVIGNNDSAQNEALIDYTALRNVKDIFNRFFGAGILKIYLDSDRYIFAQCTSWQFPDWGGQDNYIEWSAGFSAHDPWFHETTLQTVTQNFVNTVDGWGVNTEKVLNNTISANGLVWTAGGTGRTGDIAPVWPASGSVSDLGSAVQWASKSYLGVGDRVHEAISTGKYALVTVAGTTGVLEPDLTGTAHGATLTDGTVQYIVYTTIIWASGIAAPAVTANMSPEVGGNVGTDPIITMALPNYYVSILVSDYFTGEGFLIQGVPTSGGVLSIDMDEGLLTIGNMNNNHLFSGSMMTFRPGFVTYLVFEWSQPGPTGIGILYRNRWL